MVLRKDIKELDCEMDPKAEASLKPGEHLHLSHSYPFHSHSASMCIRWIQVGEPVDVFKADINRHLFKILS